MISFSEMSILNTCISQGSILGPLLFIIYIYDIAEASKIFDFIIYADDTTVSTTFEIVLKIIMLKQLVKWLILI